MGHILMRIQSELINRVIRYFKDSIYKIKHIHRKESISELLINAVFIPLWG
jgi:hypothetical protein